MVNDSRSWKAYTCRTNVSIAYHHLPSAIWLEGDVFNDNHTPEKLTVALGILGSTDILYTCSSRCQAMKTVHRGAFKVI